jgi:undecaprenyl-diphosphatase
LFKDQVEAFFGSGLSLVGIRLLITPFLLALSEWLQKKRQNVGHEITYKDAFIIGIAQACAVLPGLSRSGSTIATGLLCGVKKESVAQFSFLMVLIPILGEAFLDLLKLVQGELTSELDIAPAVVGFLAAFITGCFACRFMIEIVRRQRLIWFALYCAIVGSATIIATFC